MAVYEVRGYSNTPHCDGIEVEALCSRFKAPTAGMAKVEADAYYRQAGYKHYQITAVERTSPAPDSELSPAEHDAWPSIR